MNKQEKLEATAIVAPVIRANAKANSKRKVTTYDHATGKTVRETTVLVLQESLLAKAEILGVDVKQELKRKESGACKKCGELRKSKFATCQNKLCLKCESEAICTDCAKKIHISTLLASIRSAKPPHCHTCAGKIRRKLRPICPTCGCELGPTAKYRMNACPEKDRRCMICSARARVGKLFQRGKSKKRIGVYHNKDKSLKKRWVAQVTLPGSSKSVLIGYFFTEKEARLAYDMAACDIRGKYATCNFGEAMYI